MVILREKKEPDLHQALIILSASCTSLRQLSHPVKYLPGKSFIISTNIIAKLS